MLWSHVYPLWYTTQTQNTAHASVLDCERSTYEVWHIWLHQHGYMYFCNVGCTWVINSTESFTCPSIIENVEQEWGHRVWGYFPHSYLIVSRHWKEPWARSINLINLRHGIHRHGIQDNEKMWWLSI